MAKDTPKPPTKLETVNLKVFIHCEGCRRKVKKIIDGLEGVQSIAIDSESGKVTVTGTVDAKTLIQRLQKSGKHAEPWANPASSGSKPVTQQNQVKAGNKNSNENKSNKETKEKQGAAGEEEGENDDASNDTSNKVDGELSNGSANNNAGGGGGKGKKGGGKKGGGGGGDNGGVLEMSEAVGIASRSMAAVSVQTGYSLQSAEYATHMFSDENANNCHIM